MTKSIEERLADIERHLVNLNVEIQNSPLSLFEQNLKQLNNAFIDLYHKFSGFLTNERFSQLFLEFKYVGERLRNVEIILENLKDQGLKKSIQLDFRCDGYDLVKKPVHYDTTEPVINSDEKLNTLLSIFTEREKYILIHHFGLFGNKETTLVDIAEKLKICPKRASQLKRRAIQMLREKENRKLAKDISDVKLKKEIFYNY